MRKEVMRTAKNMAGHWLETVNPGTPVNLPGGYKRVYHVHLRKTGGTSINQSFLSMGSSARAQDHYQKLTHSFTNRINIEGRVFVGWNRSIIERGNYFFGFSHKPFQSLNLPPDTFIITCLRDPAKRALSLYKMLVEMVTSNDAHSATAIEGKWIGNNFNDFLDRCPPRHLLNQLYTFSQDLNVNEAFSAICGCNKILVTERLGEGLLELGKTLEIDLPELKVRKSTGLENPIDSESMSRLREMLAPEYKLLEMIEAEQGLKI